MSTDTKKNRTKQEYLDEIKHLEDALANTEKQHQTTINETQSNINVATANLASTFDVTKKTIEKADALIDQLKIAFDKAEKKSKL